MTYVYTPLCESVVVTTNWSRDSKPNRGRVTYVYTPLCESVVVTTNWSRDSKPNRGRVTYVYTPLCESVVVTTNWSRDAKPNRGRVISISPKKNVRVRDDNLGIRFFARLRTEWSAKTRVRKASSAQGR